MQMVVTMVWTHADGRDDSVNTCSEHMQWFSAEACDENRGVCETPADTGQDEICPSCHFGLIVSLQHIEVKELYHIRKYLSEFTSNMTEMRWAWLAA